MTKKQLADLTTRNARSYNRRFAELEARIKALEMAVKRIWPLQAEELLAPAPEDQI